MNPYESPCCDAGGKAAPRKASSWFCAKSFAAVTFLFGASVVFYQWFLLPPLAPGEGRCGMLALGGFCCMLAGTPLVALLGGIVDVFLPSIRDLFRVPSTPPPSQDADGR